MTDNDTSALLLSLLKPSPSPSPQTQCVKYETDLLWKLQNSPLIQPKSYWSKLLPQRSFYRLPQQDRRSRRQRQKERKKSDSSDLHLDLHSNSNSNSKNQTLDFELWKLSMKIDSARENGVDLSNAVEELKQLQNPTVPAPIVPTVPFHNSVDDEFDLSNNLTTSTNPVNSTSRFMPLLNHSIQSQPMPQLNHQPLPSQPPVQPIVQPLPSQIPYVQPMHLSPSSVSPPSLSSPSLPSNHPLLQLLQRKNLG